jgi:Domain of unknown function (DUF4126)
MNEVFAVGGVLSAFGLSSAAGLNAGLPLLVVGLLARFGHLDLGPSYNSLRSTPVLVAVAVYFIVDLVGDKIPGVDHVLHTIGLAVHPIAGALVFASQAGVAKHLPAPLSLALGLVTAGGFHATRAAIRPAATVVSAGIANPFVSALEDVGSGVLVALALVVPVVGALAVVALVVIAWRLLHRLHRGLRWFTGLGRDQPLDDVRPARPSS